jgi:hypothetical protein
VGSIGSITRKRAATLENDRHLDGSACRSSSHWRVKFERQESMSDDEISNKHFLALGTGQMVSRDHVVDLRYLFDACDRRRTGQVKITRL